MKIDFENLKLEMDNSDFFIPFSRVMKIMEENMSIEEAVSIIDPIKNQNVSNNSNNVSFEKTFNGLRDMKARFVVTNYVKEKLEKEKSTKN